MDFRGDRERLEIMRPEDTLDAVGQIKKIGSLAMELENCELINAIT